MYRLPRVIQGHQRMLGKLRPQDAKQIVKKALEQLSANPDPKIRHIEHLKTVSQGIQREYFHTGGRYPANGKSLFGDSYEVWSDDMACILQGTCLPGSTKYCRTKSMFGKLDLTDIMQGTSTKRQMSTLTMASAPICRTFHTLVIPTLTSGLQVRQQLPRKVYGHDGSRASSCLKSGLSKDEWNEEIACVLQGTCLPGSTRYCRTKSMFGSLNLKDVMQGSLHRCYSTRPSSSDTQTSSSATADSQLTQRQRLTIAMRDYGSTVIVFHICISLMSLGSFYLAVSSGLDVQSLLKTIGLSSDTVSSRIATGTSTFLVAYGVHKVFAPVRIAVTLTCTPFIVRYLRGIGLLKIKSVPISK
ncbi:uncharacterized protein LOC117289191 [Asterias rubens]|uniref:uncharacterized protein LOC117289191 n=1 Tax=Asterias rubens TaxID=7604 RepID=UPI001455D447|nr:uncharacterized protein LOC117289191 [Asterias rubens]